MDEDKLIEFPLDRNIEDIISLCYNAFYNPEYIENGRIKTRTEIIKDMKSKVIESLVEYFGEEYRSLIEKRIWSCSYKFKFQMNKNNSVENALEDLSKFVYEQMPEMIKNIRDIGFSSQVDLNPCELEVLSDLFNRDITEDDMHNDSIFCDKDNEVNIMDKLLFLTGMNRYQIVLFLCGYDAECCGVSPEIYNRTIRLRDYMQSHRFVRDKGYDYSPVPWVEKSIKGLEKMTMDYEKFIDDNMVEDLFGYIVDPIKRWSCDQDLDRNEILFNRYYNVHGSFKKGKNVDDEVSLGPLPRDYSIIHESLHAVAQCGYAKGSDEICLFDEIVTSYFEHEICNQRRESGKKPIVVDKQIDSLYTNFFCIMEDFLRKYEPQIKAGYLSENPRGYLSGVIGEDTYNRLSEIINDLLELGSGPCFDFLEDSNNPKLRKFYEDNLSDCDSQNRLKMYLKLVTEYAQEIDEECNNGNLTASVKKDIQNLREFKQIMDTLLMGPSKNNFVQ